MARREIARATSAMIRAIGEASDPHADPVRLAIRVLIAEFSRQRKARHIAFQTLVAEGFGAELESNLDEVAQVLAARSGQIVPGRTAPIPPVTAFLLTRAVNGILSSAAREGSPYLGTIEFEDELVRLVRGFLNGIPQDAR